MMSKYHYSNYNKKKYHCPNYNMTLTEGFIISVTCPTAMHCVKTKTRKVNNFSYLICDFSMSINNKQ